MQESGQALHEHQYGEREEGPHREYHVQLDGRHARLAHAHAQHALP